MQTKTLPLPKQVPLLLKLFGCVLVLFGLCLTIGGGYLVTLGGSWYYLIAGVGIAVSGLWSIQGHRTGLWLYLAVFIATCIWAFVEVGTNFWGWVPRTATLLGFAIAGLYLAPLYTRNERVLISNNNCIALATLLLLVLAGDVVLMTKPHGEIRNEVVLSPGQVSSTTDAAGNSWENYGRTGEGNRFVPLDQINAANVSQLEVAWTYEAKGLEENQEDQNTPLFVDGTLYRCSPSNMITALDASTGERKWTYDPKASSPFWNRCRGTAYFKPPVDNACGPRVIVATVDMRLISIKTSDGSLCESFGDQGIVDLSEGVGTAPLGMYMQTTGAMVAGDQIVIGGWVADNVSTDEPSGVIRAFDALTGKLNWAWDMGNAQITGLPPAGQTYTRSTPNAWAPMSFDLKLGTVFVPLGNPTPDYWGGKRTAVDDKYSSSLVALDLRTGREKWSFQTTHHDLWDYDLPSQPALYELNDENGQSIPAVIQLTKRGQIFVLNRETGVPITTVEERAVPAGQAEGERYSPTQPYSTGMPSVGAEPLAEAKTWGITPLDQLYCRISFKKSTYVGDFTPSPADMSNYLQYPSNYGGFNWGSAAIDQKRNLLLVNDLRMPMLARLTTREEVDTMNGIDPHGEYSKMKGTPYGYKVDMFMSPLGVPCMQPPYGTLSAIDLVSKKLVWQVPVGTVAESGPLGIKMGVPFLPGMPTLGGSVATASGLMFFGGASDYKLRAFDVQTGKELWQGSLPTGAQATPITYMDEKTGRQMVVITASGAPHNPHDRDKSYVVAFALPKEAISK